MSRFRAWWGRLLVLLLAVGIHTSSATAQTTPPVDFEVVDCETLLGSDLLVASLEELEPIECGWLTVPESYSTPDGSTLRLAVVRLFADTPSGTSATPLVFAQGGPGGSTIDTYLQVLPESAVFTRRDRDLILFDQRGTLYSEPYLFCEEVYDLTLETLDDDLADDEASALSREAIAACRDRFVSEGVDLSVFDSVENANDVRALRDALGYGQINLYGVSYGTELAQYVMRDHPDILRSVILDAVVSPAESFLLVAAQSQQRAFDALFAACRSDLRCNAAFPNLEEGFYRDINRLNDEPVFITVTDTDTGTSYPALLDGDSFAGLIFQMLYATDFIPLLPLVIDDASRNEFSVLERIASLVIFDRTFADGMYLSVICASDMDADPAALDLSGVRPEIAEGEAESLDEFLDTCEVWQIEQLAVGEDLELVLSSDIPTLLLSGAFDPITPPANADVVASGLPNSYHLVNPVGGHGFAFDTACADQIVSDFLADPNTRPDASCLEENPTVDFAVPDDIIRVPSLLALLNVQMPQIAWLGVLGGALLVLLSFWLVEPIGWLIRVASRTPRAPQPLLGHLAPWLVALLGVLLLVLLIGVAGVVLSLAFDNDNRLLFGLPAAYRPLLLLPLLVAPLALGLLASSVLAWLVPYWSLLRRIYYLLLSGAALLAVAALTALGLLTAGL